MSVRRSIMITLTLVLATFPVRAGTTSLVEARALLEQKRFDAAEQAARLVLAQTEAAHGPTSIEVAEVLQVLLVVLRSGTGAASERLELSERTVRINEQLLAARSIRTLQRACGNWAQRSWPQEISAGRGSCSNVRSHFTESAFGPNHPEVAGVAAQFATFFYNYSGDYSAARRYYQRSIAIRQVAFGEDDPRVAGSLVGLANVFLSAGDHDGAQPLLERALVIYNRSRLADDLFVFGATYRNVGRCHFHAGDYVKARGFYEQELAIREKWHDGEDRSVEMLGILSRDRQLRRSLPAN